MDDFWSDSFGRKSDPFFGETSPFDRRTFDSPFSVLHHSMQQMHREMDEMMRHAFGQFPSSIQQPYRPAIMSPQANNKDQDLDKQVQQYGVGSLFDEDQSDWDFVKRLEQLEKQPKDKLIMQTDPKTGAQYYGRSHFHTYSSTGDGKVEERKVIQGEFNLLN